ncbi:MAG: glycosyltransferase family 39 protein [Terrimicrobiaceae bacterium]
MRFKIPSSLLSAGPMVGILCLGVCLWLIFAHNPWKVLAADPELERLRSLVRFYGWWAAAMNAVLLLVLAFTARWWAAPMTAHAGPWLPKISASRWFWPVVLVAMLITAIQGLQRIDQSLWDDEDSSVRLQIHGELQKQDDGSLKWRHPKWQEAFYYYRRPSNHHLQTILSRVFHDTWKAVAGPSGLQLNEPVMRIPVLIAAVGSIFGMALLLRRLGFPRAAGLAALLLAIHPWHIRYAIELRGYAFTLLFLPLLIWLLLEAIERRRWRWWAAFALCEFLLLYSHPSTLYVLVVANGLGLVAVLLRNRASSPWWQQPSRLIVANLFAGMVYLQLMLPCLPQLKAYLATATSLGVLNDRWNRNLASHFFSGIPWNNSDSAESGALELRWIAEASPWTYQIAFLAVTGCLLFGFVRLLVARPVGWLVGASFVLPGTLVYAFALRNGNYLYEWYLIPALPGLVALVAIGLDGLATPLARWQRWAPPVLLTVGVLGFGFVTSPARTWLLENSIQPMRESVLSLRPTLDPYDPRQKDVLTGRLNAPPRSYDPNAISVSSMPKFLAALRLADETGLPFHINYGNLPAASVDYPNIYRMIEDDALFEKVTVLRGLDPSLDRHIRRYRHGSLANYPIPDADK